jgi:hypothetical protein
VWPHLSLADIADELFLEVEAGSTGKPNQAIEINNWKKMLPFLIQLGIISRIGSPGRRCAARRPARPHRRHRPADQRGGSGPAFGSNQVQNPV